MNPAPMFDVNVEKQNMLAEIERLRASLRMISRMKTLPNHAANTMTLVAAKKIAEQALGILIG